MRSAIKVREWLSLLKTSTEYLPDDSEYEVIFDSFEYLQAPVYMDLVDPKRSPVGLYCWRHRRRIDHWENYPFSELTSNALEEGDDCGLLGAGFFGGSASRLKEVAAIHKTVARKIISDWPPF